MFTKIQLDFMPISPQTQNLLMPIHVAASLKSFDSLPNIFCVVDSLSIRFVKAITMVP